MIKSKKIYAGVYKITTDKNQFYVERMSAISSDHAEWKDNTWMLNRVDENGNLEYWNHFWTKREAIDAIKRSSKN
jgi:hypothetical protein